MQCVCGEIAIRGKWKIMTQHQHEVLSIHDVSWVSEFVCMLLPSSRASNVTVNERDYIAAAVPLFNIRSQRKNSTLITGCLHKTFHNKVL